MNRTELVRRLVLNSICDDFGNIDQVILRDVAKEAAELGLTIERAGVVDALASLINDGLAKAYVLPGPTRDPFSGALQGTPPVDVIEEDFKTYFYITNTGMDLHLGIDDWSLDEEKT